MVINHSTIHVLVTNSALPRHPVKTEPVHIRIDHIAEVKNAWIERIDDTHANATAAWEAMGSPGTLSRSQAAKLESASALVMEVQSFSLDKDSAFLEIDLPPQGTALITLETL
jgi:xylan 1,4-beta-xylosidase